MCVRILGDKTGLDDDIRMRIAELEEATRNNLTASIFRLPFKLRRAGMRLYGR